jgi:hypothetical protein
MGVAVSPVKAGSAWVIVEAEDGGIFHTENGGATWTKVNDQREVKQRAWYYSGFCRPEECGYDLCTNTSLSVDRWRTYVRSDSDGHGDNHDL